MYWNTEDVLLAIFGGALIGIATSIHYLVMGKTTGFSGLLYSLISFDQKNFWWKLSLLSSVMVMSSLMFMIFEFKHPIIPGATPAFDPPIIVALIGWFWGPLAGFLVGFGTKLSNGCTSGHGVCGLPRLSQRSIAAVCCFMASGVCSATLKHYVIGENFTNPHNPIKDSAYETLGATFFGIGLLTIAASFYFQIKQNSFMRNDIIVATVVGLIFGLGLVVSGMVKRSKILGFLVINKHWDPSLLFVMLTAVAFNFITFRSRSKPLLSSKFDVPTNTEVDQKLILGAVIFGVGWGIGGLCPGPAIALFPEFTIQVGILFMGALVAGQLVGNMVSQKMDSSKVDPLLG